MNEAEVQNNERLSRRQFIDRNADRAACAQAAIRELRSLWQANDAALREMAAKAVEEERAEQVLLARLGALRRETEQLTDETTSIEVAKHKAASDRASLERRESSASVAVRKGVDKWIEDLAELRAPQQENEAELLQIDPNLSVHRRTKDVVAETDRLRFRIEKIRDLCVDAERTGDRFERRRLEAKRNALGAIRLARKARRQAAISNEISCLLDSQAKRLHHARKSDALRLDRAERKAARRERRRVRLELASKLSALSPNQAVDTLPSNKRHLAAALETCHRQYDDAAASVAALADQAVAEKGRLQSAAGGLAEAERETAVLASSVGAEVREKREALGSARSKLLKEESTLTGGKSKARGDVDRTRLVRDGGNESDDSTRARRQEEEGLTSTHVRWLSGTSASRKAENIIWSSEAPPPRTSVLFRHFGEVVQDLQNAADSRVSQSDLLYRATKCAYLEWLRAKKE